MIITMLHKIKDHIQNHLTDVQLTVYIDNLRKKSLENLPDQELDHVEHCDKCKQAIIEMYAFLEDDVIKTIPFTPGNYENKGINFQWKQAVAVAATIVFLPTLLYFTTVFSVSDTVNENFQTHRILELLVNDQVRSSNLDILSPIKGEEIKYSPSLQFSWNWSKREPLTFQMYSNTHEEIISLTTTEGNVEFENIYDRGLYYWQLTDENDLLYTGKFILR